MIHQKKGLKSCAKEILGELWQKIDVDFLYENGDAGGKRAHMVFPEHYDEAVENTPARILFTEYHGSGTNYRQCFYSKELDFAEYDSLFDMPFPYMMCMHNAPVNSGDVDADFHFHVEFFPPLRSANQQKFNASSETGAWAHCNPRCPEETAAELREAYDRYQNSL